jgi:hypothetical protein
LLLPLAKLTTENKICQNSSTEVFRIFRSHKIWTLDVTEYEAQQLMKAYQNALAIHEILLPVIVMNMQVFWDVMSRQLVHTDTSVEHHAPSSCMARQLKR